MSYALRRTVGVMCVLGSIALATWLVFGSPQDWEGGMRWLRHGLGLASLGAIHGGAWLMFPDRQERTPDAVTGQDDNASAAART